MSKRGRYLALAIATIVIGLAIHWQGAALGSAGQDFVGDALWAAMIMWWIGTLAPDARLRVRTAVALSICFVVETSQLYHAPWLDAVRATTLGHLTLGSDFDARDLIAYSFGVLGSALLDRRVLKLRGERIRAA